MYFSQQSHHLWTSVKTNLNNPHLMYQCIMDHVLIYSSHILMQEVISLKQIYLMTKTTYMQLLIKSLFNSEAFFKSREIS